MLQALATSNILCGSFLLEYLKIERNEGHEQNEFPFGACLCACYTLKMYIRVVFSSTIYLKIEHKEDMNKICPRRGDFCACGAL